MATGTAEAPPTGTPPPQPVMGPKGPTANVGMEAESPPTAQTEAQQVGMLYNAIMSRASLLSTAFDPRRDLYAECGYPTNIMIGDYQKMFDREGVGTRVCGILPQETWRRDPTLTENADVDDVTDFEETWAKIVKKHNPWGPLCEVDEMSGVGHFGLLLVGINDGKELREPVDGIVLEGPTTGQRTTAGDPTAGEPRKITFLRTFSESFVVVEAFETDQKSPRFGRPTMYNVKFLDPASQETSAMGASALAAEHKVHWTRVVHVADGKKGSMVYGTPRQRPVWNRLLDIQKIASGSGEMFWRGAFPGISMESQPDLAGADFDLDEMKTQLEKYMNGLQRYLTTTGMTANSLAPQVADPSNSLDAQIKLVCITIGVPYRVFMGSEQAVLASSEDAKAWNARLGHRQEKYVTPDIIVPFIELLKLMRVLPPCAEEDEDGTGGYDVRWPDLFTPSEAERMEVAKLMVEAMAAYISSGVDALIPPLDFLVVVLGMDRDDAEEILKSALEHIEEQEAHEADLAADVQGRELDGAVKAIEAGTVQDPTKPPPQPPLPRPVAI